jgi:DNA-binding response OmpR family regulator
MSSSAPGHRIEPDSRGGRGVFARATIRVLIIDDDILEDGGMARCLRLAGFDLRCAQTGADGLARAAADPSDAIVVDLHLPDILGITLMSELRRARVHVPVIAITGYYVDSGHEEAASGLGAAGFMRKPVLPDELETALRAAVATFVPDSSALTQVSTASAARRPVHRRQRAAAKDTGLAVLHGRVIHGDTSALEQICALLLPALVRALSARFRTVDLELVHDAVVDAILDYRANPARYDPSRGSHSFVGCCSPPSAIC